MMEEARHTGDGIGTLNKLIFGFDFRDFFRSGKLLLPGSKAKAPRKSGLLAVKRRILRQYTILRCPATADRTGPRLAWTF